MDDVSDVREYYQGGVEEEDARLARHQLERDLTWRYLTRYLPRGGSVGRKHNDEVSA